MKRTSFIKRVLSGFGTLVVTDIICLVLTMMVIKFMGNIVISIIAAIFFLSVLVLSLLSYGYKYGEQDKKLEKRGNPIDLNMSKKLGAAVSIPLIVFWVCLILSKLGVVMDLLPYYKLTNAFFLPVVQIITKGVEIGGFPFYGFILLFVLIIIIIPVGIYIGYDLGYKQVDLTLKIFYKKKS